MFYYSNLENFFFYSSVDRIFILPRYEGKNKMGLHAILVRHIEEETGKYTCERKL